MNSENFLWTFVTIFRGTYKRYCLLSVILQPKHRKSILLNILKFGAGFAFLLCLVRNTVSRFKLFTYYMSVSEAGIPVRPSKPDSFFSRLQSDEGCFKIFIVNSW